MQPSFRRILGSSARHRHLGALGVLVVVICGAYAAVLDGTRSLITNGPWSQPLFVVDPLAGGPATTPLTRLAATAWSHLHLPVIDPFQGFGIPLLTNQGVPVYPPELVFHLLFPANYSIWNVVDLVALAYGVYLLATSYGVGFFGAIAAGLLAALAGAAPPNVNMSMLNPLAMLPFVLLAARYTLDPRVVRPVVASLGVATTIAFLCLSGFQEVLPLMAVVIVVYAIAAIIHFRTWERPLLILATVGSAIVGGAIGSIGILPTLSLVGTDTTLNSTTSYLPHLPTSWLATLALPTITGRALNQAPQDAGNAAFTLGTPLLALVVVLALAVAIRQQGGGTRWFVFPSVAFVVYGVLGYADIGRVLQAFDIPLFDVIQSRRFLQFAWWIPLCLLLGVVISRARVLRWTDALVALVLAAGFDAYLFERYRQSLTADHVSDSSASIVHAPVVAAAVVVVFLAAALTARRFGPVPTGLVMAVVVLASCLYDLPTNFPPSSFDSSVTSVPVAGSSGRGENQLTFFGTRQLPTEEPSFQIYGPLIPAAYRDVLVDLFSVPEAGGLDPIAGSLPTLAQLDLTPRAVSVLGSLGVSRLVVSTPLPSSSFPSIPACGQSTVAAEEGLVCFLGKTVTAHPGVAYAPPDTYAYRILGADALVERTAIPVAVASTRTALQDYAGRLSTTTTTLPGDAYITTSAKSLPAAQGVTDVSRTATTQTVTISLHSTSAGVVVLRQTYQAGLHATVNGRSVSAMPVDGGLWTAVRVPTGSSRIVLDYTTGAETIEFVLGALGLAVLALAWIGVAAVELRRRFRHRPRGATRVYDQSLPASALEPALATASTSGEPTAVSDEPAIEEGAPTGAPGAPVPDGPQPGT